MLEPKYTASEQSLGYMYQARFALLRLLQLPEDTAVLIEKDDDLDFIDSEGTKSLTSLKHKAIGDRLTNLSTDFWKSVRIWLASYNRDGRLGCNLRFFIFTTSKVAEDSFLSSFLSTTKPDIHSILSLAQDVLAKTGSQTILPIKVEFDKLNEKERKDFLSRIIIFDDNLRIDEVPDQIRNQYMRTIRPQFRTAVLERLEGWWNDVVVQLLSKKRTTEVFGRELSDKLSEIADEFKTDNLPIDFRRAKPEEGAHPENDDRLFVVQLRTIGIQTGRIQNAIYDYYRAFQQRSSWARETLLLGGEMEEYEERLINEWERYRDVICESLRDDSVEDELIAAGRELYNWAELNTNYLRIRERVSEPYVVRGNYHILANQHPIPKVYWHPKFLQRIENILLGSAK